MEKNWTISQTKELFDLVYHAVENNRGLNSAFTKMSERCGRSVNSVRNYYYSQLKMFELVPTLAKDLGIKTVSVQRADFELFTEAEIATLIERVLTAKANGISVRAAIAEMANGDAKLALRLQNKYRSMLAHHRDRVTAVMEDMNARGVVYYNPYRKSVVDGDNLALLTEYISKLDEGEAGSFLNLIKKLV